MYLYFNLSKLYQLNIFYFVVIASISLLLLCMCIASLILILYSVIIVKIKKLVKNKSSGTSIVMFINVSVKLK